MTKPYQIVNILTFGQKYNETCIAGIKMKLNTPQDNINDGFYFEDCEVIDLPDFGYVYFFEDYCYMIDGYQWLKFKYSDYLIKNN